MTRVLRLALALVVVAVGAFGQPRSGTDGRRDRGAPATPAPEPDAHAPAKSAGELDCRTCHRGTHQGVLAMYVGMGGRGTPMIPSHMFQVRVQCVACHVVPEAPKDKAALVGQTFRPGEQACLGCHGTKYRGMLGRWTATLAKMRSIVEPKLTGTRATLAESSTKDPKVTRARRLLDDAQFNLQYVELAKGVHNVFYAADLLKLANGWTDEAAALLGAKRAATDDALVRGGYCAVLCHEQAGVEQRTTVMFGKQRLPHVRHVTEFGAVCTACHSPEVHKAVTATPATCAGCHHSPQNERCETCHRAQSAFYRGAVNTPLAKVDPNIMADAVGCTGCHDFSVKHSRQAVAQKCIGCHDKGYMGFVKEWTTDLDAAAAKTADAVKNADATLSRVRRSGRPDLEAERLLQDARAALVLVRGSRPIHNPSGAEALLDAARKRAEEALARAAAQ